MATTRRPELPFATTQKLRASVINFANDEPGRNITHAHVKKFLVSEGHPQLSVHGFMRTMVDRKIFFHNKETMTYTLVMDSAQACKLAFIQNMCGSRKKAPETQGVLKLSTDACIGTEALPGYSSFVGTKALPPHSVDVKVAGRQHKHKLKDSPVNEVQVNWLNMWMVLMLTALCYIAVILTLVAFG